MENYRKIQSQVKILRESGAISKCIKLNQKKCILQDILKNSIKKYKKYRKILKQQTKSIEDFEKNDELVNKTYEESLAIREINKGKMEGFAKLFSIRGKLTQAEVDAYKCMIDNNPEKTVLSFKSSKNDEEFELPATDKNWADISQILTHGNSGYTEVATMGSGMQSQIMIESYNQAKSTNLKPSKKIYNSSAKYFGLENTTDISLVRYQIIKSTDSQECLKNHCLIHSLRESGIPEAQLSEICLSFTPNVSFPKCKLKEVSQIIKKNIILTTPCNKVDAKHNQTTVVFGDHDESIKLGIVNDHYFINENTNCTTYCSKKYADIRNENNYMNIIKKVKGKYKRSNNPIYKCTSFNLINNLFNSGHFVKNSQLFGNLDVHVSKGDDDIREICLDNILAEQEPVSSQDDTKKKQKNVRTPSIPKDQLIFYADCESLVGGGEHIGFLMGVAYEHDTEVQIFQSSKEYPNNWCNNAFKWISEKAKNINPDADVIIYYHNLKYDYALLKKNLRIFKAPLEKDGQVYEVQFYNFKRVFICRDSYKFIDKPLSDFSKTFDLDKKYNKKEAIGYGYYNATNIYSDTASITEYKKFVKSYEHKTFKENIQMKNKKGEYKFKYDPVKKTFDHMLYYKYYLKYDVLVLKLGFQALGEKIKKISKLNIHEFRTISSLTNSYMESNGAFDDLYKVRGNLRYYISKSIRGGRVNCLESTKCSVLKGKFADYDGVSLYPSAIYRLCLEMGLPKGMCKRIASYNKAELDATSDYYIVTVKIKAINKKQQMPFISVESSNGTLDYINEIKSEKGEVVVVDSITLADYIKFHDIEYEILDGVYWNEGYNKKMGTIIKELFDDRKLEKKKGNDCMQKVIKLMLNSAYGKTILKKTKIQNIILTVPPNDMTKLHNYVFKHFEVIKKYYQLNKFQYVITKYKMDNSANLGHVGSLILSYSKRIMNEVMDVANSNNMPVYYQDTDSMHVNYDDVPRLAELFAKEYNGRELTGSNLGQFHVDFELDGAVGEIYSSMLIPLGKKSYLDVLESTDKDGNRITGIHSRMKGCTREGLNKKAEECGGYVNMYTKLADGEEMSIILNPKDKVLFEFSGTGVQTKDEFSRDICFKKTKKIKNNKK